MEEFSVQNFKLLTKITGFSNESIHKPGEVAVFSHISEDALSRRSTYFAEELSLDVYANGMNRESKGHISVAFLSMRPLLAPFYKYFELCFVAAVIDVSGDQRFSKSYKFPYNPNWQTEAKNPFSVTFTVDRFLSRETILKNPSELLPDDCLTLNFDVQITTTATGSHQIPLDAFVQNSFAIEESEGRTKYFLHLDSGLAENLREESSFFRTMDETPMLEKTTRYMNVPSEEYPALRDACFVLMGTKYVTVNSINDVCQMYAVSDKYDIPKATEMCRSLLISFLSIEDDEIFVENVLGKLESLFEFFQMYRHDHRLKEMMENFKLKDSLDTYWKCELLGKEPLLYFTFSREIKESIPNSACYC